uniref:Uncharacterized protein n=1 Tax=Micrurus spixii TaxID=129469 RepID=A0A2D4MJR7_9SAUR
MREWINLKNRRLLTLEGHDLQLGWYTFLWDKKHNAHQYFQRHYIRSVLLRVWTKIKQQNYIETLVWFSMLEALMHPNFINLGKVITYKDIVNENGELKSRQELREEGVQLEWWAYL